MEKRYFISDIEEMLNVHRNTYFYWEKTKKVPAAKRTKTGNYRYWTEADIKQLMELTGMEEAVVNNIE